MTISTKQLKDTEYFIKKAKQIHGELYDYSKVNYIRCSQKVTIICQKHGEFLVSAGAHISTHRLGCPHCSNERLFLALSKTKHGDRFDYPDLKLFVNGPGFITAHCKKHNYSFNIHRTKHFRKEHGGCKFCRKEKIPSCECGIILKAGMSVCTNCTRKQQIILKKQLHFQNIVQQIKTKFNNKLDTSLVTDKGGKQHFICNDCNHHFFKSICVVVKLTEPCIKCYQSKMNDLVEKNNARIKNHFESLCGKEAVNPNSFKIQKNKIFFRCDKHNEQCCGKINFLHKKFLCTPCYIENSYKYTTQEFITELRKVHGDTYLYDKTVYNGRKTKINITCRKHGDFYQSPRHHRDGQGCAACYTEINHRYTTQEFIEQAKKVHGDLYLYHKTVYNGRRKHVIITCREHGDFKQSPRGHRAGRGCPSCGALRGNIGKNEANLFTPFLQSIDNSFIPQFRVAAECGNYFIDFYYPHLKLAIEYDEDKHYEKQNIKKDRERQFYIENKLGCTFIRVNDKKFVQNPNYARFLLNDYFDCLIYQDTSELFS